MKQLFLLFFIVLIVLQLKAQYIYDEYDEIIPFSLTEKYKDKIRTDDIHTIVLPSFDNDSLCKEYNNGKHLHELGTSYYGGFRIDSEINSFKDRATKLEIEEGTLWIFTIESPTAGGLKVGIEEFIIPKDAYFCIYPGLIPHEIEGPEVYTSDNIPNKFVKEGFRRTVYDKKIVLEYFEPNSITGTNDFMIDYIGYSFVSATKERSEYRENQKNILKSGGWTKVPAYDCQKDVVCDEVKSWKNEAKSVVFIRLEYEITENEWILSDGAGFFINKAGNYTETDNPILISCGHLYYPEGIDLIDKSVDLYVRVDYENQECNETKTRRGKSLPGAFNRLKYGNSYNKEGHTDYNPSEDYAIFQTSKTVKNLSRYNINYAGWNTNFDLLNSSNTGYTYIGHPSGDVKKVCVDNGYAWVNSNGQEFGLYPDIGTNQGGFSGGPVFNSEKEVVGWVCTRGNGNADPCEIVGQDISQNRTGCGRLDNIWSLNEFASNVDPNGIGEATSTSPSPPAPSELPDHCNNCIPDGDETGIDCGGSCYPCGMLDVLTVKTPMDIAGSAKSRYELFADPDPSTLLALKGGSYSLEAGMNVYLNGGFEVEKGAEFYAGVDAELMTEADRGCQLPCVDLADVFTPNGDGINDYWGFSQAFVESYDLLIWDRNGNIIYSTNNQPVYTNGIIASWDGAGTVSGAVYYGTLTYSDCFGNNHDEDFFTHVYSNKSAIISANGVDSEKATNATAAAINFKTPELEVYPNPFSEEVVVNYTGNSFPLKVKINDIKGKLLFTKEINNPHQKIKMSRFSPGTYIINAKAGEYNLVQKLIKK